MDQGSKDEEEGKNLTHTFGILPMSSNFATGHLPKHPEMERHPEVPQYVSPIGHQPYLGGGAGLNSAVLRSSSDGVGHECQNANTFSNSQSHFSVGHIGQGLHQNYDQSSLVGRTMNFPGTVPYSHYNNMPDFNSSNYPRLPYSSDLSSNGCLPNVSSQLGNFVRPSYGNPLINPANTPIMERDSHQSFGGGLNSEYHGTPAADSSDDYLKRMKNKRLLGGTPIGAPAPKIKRKRQKDAIMESRVREDQTPSISEQQPSTFVGERHSRILDSKQIEMPTSLAQTHNNHNVNANLCSTMGSLYSQNPEASYALPAVSESSATPAPGVSADHEKLRSSPGNQIMDPAQNIPFAPDSNVPVITSEVSNTKSDVHFSQLNANVSLAGIENLIRETSTTFTPTLHTMPSVDSSRQDNVSYTDATSSTTTGTTTTTSNNSDSVNTVFTEIDGLSSNPNVGGEDNLKACEGPSAITDDHISQPLSNLSQHNSSDHKPSDLTDNSQFSFENLGSQDKSGDPLSKEYTPEQTASVQEPTSATPSPCDASSALETEHPANLEQDLEHPVTLVSTPSNASVNQDQVEESISSEEVPSCPTVDDPMTLHPQKENESVMEPRSHDDANHPPENTAASPAPSKQKDETGSSENDALNVAGMLDMNDSSQNKNPNQSPENPSSEAKEPSGSFEEEKNNLTGEVDNGDKSDERVKSAASSDEEGDGNSSDVDSMKLPVRKMLGAGTGLSAKPKVKNLRRNIREIISDDKLEENTLAAQKEEQMRLQRLQEKRAAMREYMEQQQVERLVAEVAEAAEAVTAAEAVEEVEAAEEAAAAAAADDEEEEGEEEDAKSRPGDDEIVVLSPEEGPKVKLSDSEPESDPEDEDEEEEELLVPKKEIKSEPEDSADEDDLKSKPSEESESESDSDVVVLSQSEEEEEEEDINNSGAHINDEFNMADAQGRVLVNVGHPEKEEDILLAPQLAAAVKPHQIGGIRFLYDNIVESLEQFKTSNGFGCILAHSMGLGKTLQVVSFTDVFLRHTNSRTVLIIVPINTLQNWLAEYNQWLPEEVPPDLPEGLEVRPRQFKVFLLNDAHKTLPARARVIKEWSEQGGVLLMGYELYRQLSLKKPKKPKKKKKRIIDDEIVDIEEEDHNKVLLDEMQKAIVRPGPDLVICDEGHRIKNAHANISQALKNIRTKRRVVLTGYPLQNNLLEYWCMVDFVRPNYLGTKTEFSNMFERPIQNGQCVDSTPQDVKVMRYRAHVLHSLLEGFVQRRGHSVLAKTLPAKKEHVLLCRMTPMQRKLYSAYMAELTGTKATANPLKAFAICCKIWNHPDVMYNFVMRRMNEDYDLDLDEVVGKPKKTKKGSAKEPENAPPQVQPFTNSSNNWGASPNPPLPRSGMGMNAQHPPMSVASPMSGGMGIPPNMGQQSHLPPSNMMHPAMTHPGMAAHSQNNHLTHPGMGMSRDGSNPTLGMGGYGMGMFNMQQGYNMHQMPPPPPYPWMGYNQPYPNPNDPNMQHYPSPYGPPYPQYPQIPQQQQPPNPQQQQTPLPSHLQQQQQIPPQSLPPYSPLMPPHMQHPMNMVPPPAHPSMHPITSQPQNSLNDSGLQNIPQQSALNLSHQATSQGMHQQEMQAALSSTSNSLLSQSSPKLLEQSNRAQLSNEAMSGASTPSSHDPSLSSLEDQTRSPMQQEPLNAAMQTPTGQMLASDQVKQESIPQNSLFSNISDQAQNINFGNSLPNLMQQQQQHHQVAQNVFQTNAPELPNISNQMKDLALNESMSADTKDVKKESTIKEEIKNWHIREGDHANASAKTAKKDDLCGEEGKEEKSSGLKDPAASKDSGDEENEEKKDEKQDAKKDEISFEWAETILKDYTPGLLENSTKFQIFFKILEGTIKVNDRLLVFSQSLFTLSLLEEFLQRTPVPGTGDGWMKGRTYFRLDGSTSAQDREKLINEFNTNPGVKLFLVSTRAGSLGINLVGANRVVVFDASFNPCHDTQAVCRVYRYGQQKACHIYRFVTDNSLERRIYDRQVNKQGISDRIVDEMNPEAHLSSKEISNLLVDNEEDPEPEDFSDKISTFNDEIMESILEDKNNLLTRPPFSHESLLVDRKDKKLSNAEKRLAKRSYELEKQANISYSRPTYGGFYPKGGSQTVMMGTKIGGIVYAKPVGTVRPMQSEMGQKIEGGGAMMHRPNILSRSGQSSYPVESLAKQGVSVQQITVPKDVSIPTNSGDGKPIQLKSGQSVMVIKTQKGMYLRLSDGKIVAIRVPPGNDAFGLPLNQGSVTIVPTMVSGPRPRGGGRGGGAGVTPTRRGRPPMSAQYALGQVVPKGASKGQMAVRILRKPVVGSRGGRAYQTIAVPVSSSSQGTLLNKSVIITPAKSGANHNKLIKDLKISPKVQITPVPSKSSGLMSIAGTSGLTKRLNRNNKIISAQAAHAFKAEEEKKQLMKIKSTSGKKDAPEETLASPAEELPLSRQHEDTKEETDGDSHPNIYTEGAKETEKSSVSSPMETELSLDANSIHSSKSEESNLDKIADQLKSPIELTSMTSPNSFTDDSASHKGSPANSGSENHSHVVPSSVVSVEVEKGQKSPPGGAFPNEPLTGIVRPMVHHSTGTGMTPLEGLSNLVPHSEEAPERSHFSTVSSAPITQPSFSPHTSFSSTPQPLFQPFLQQTTPKTSTVSSLISSNPNVAHVSPQVQGLATDLTSQSSYSSPSQSLFTSSSPARSPIQGLHSLSNNLPFSMSAPSSIPHSQPSLVNPAGLVSSATPPPTNTFSSPQSSIVQSPAPTIASSSISSGDNPLSLANLLPSQNFNQPTSENTSHSSSMDYLNYSISNSSAFRRPDYPVISSDIQSMISPTSSASNTPPPIVASASTVASTPTTSPSVTSPVTFADHASSYQYSSSYRGHTSPPTGFRTPAMTPTGYPYPGQYGPPFPGQYSTLNTPAGASATPQSNSMNQFSGIQTPNPYHQAFGPPTTTAIPPYPSGLGGFPSTTYPPPPPM